MAIVTPGDSNLGRNSGTNLSGNSIPPRGQGDVYLDKGIENELAACYKNLVNYGILLPAYGLQWRDEVLNLLSSSNTNKIAEFDELSMNVIMDVRNTELASSGQKYKLNCSGYLFKDYCNNITSINYSGVSSFNISLAKFSFGGLPGEWYVRNGQLCKLEIVSTFDGRSPDLGDNSNPPPVKNPPPAPAPLLGSGQCYIPLYSDDVIETEEIITQGMWFTNGANEYGEYGNKYSGSYNMRFHKESQLLNFNDTANYIIDVYNVHDDEFPEICRSNYLQYKVIYADYDGRGDIDLGGLDSETMTKAMYSQYSNILLPKNQNKFIINGLEQDYVYIIDIERSRYENSIDPGNWQFTLCQMDFYQNHPTTGSNSVYDLKAGGIYDTVPYSFIDDSYGQEVHFTNRVYNIVPGRLEGGPDSQIPAGILTSSYWPGIDSIGLFYPNHGIYVLSGNLLDTYMGFRTNRNIQKNGLNPYRLIKCLHLSSEQADAEGFDSSGDGYGFLSRSIVKKYNKIYFIRVKNQQLNYSNNPTYQISGSTGTIIDGFMGTEKAYFTTVGLYNQNKELLAVGKVSKATLSSATEETLFTVKVSL